MKTRTRRSKSPSIGKTRWLAYATASAATALAGSQSVEGSIHYSGRLDVPFPSNKDHVKTFPLDQAGDFISFQRVEVGHAFFAATDVAYFRIFGIAAASFQAHSTSYRAFVHKLPRGQNISSGFFVPQPSYYFDGGVIGSGHASFYSSWGDPGTGYVGFRFNNGSGRQYGWARVLVSGQPEHAFRVLDYAYADPGEPIRAGQRSSAEQVLDQRSTDENAPDEGSLGGLALGAVGLMAWRKSRSRTARYPRHSVPV